MSRLMRALMRLALPLRLAHIDYLRKHSASELEHLCGLRDGLIHRQKAENIKQVRLEERRNRILRGQL